MVLVSQYSTIFPTIIIITIIYIYILYNKKNGLLWLFSCLCVCVFAVFRDIVIAQEVPVEPHALGSSFPPHSPLVAV